MGQIIGKLPIKSSFKKLINLPKTVIVDLRCAVAEVSESYSLTSKELEQVLLLSLHVFLSDEKIREYNNDLFSLFNADALPGQECDEIDSFELLGTLCLTSGMLLREKVAFLFDLFDLNEKAELSINEVTLAFRSLVSGARKITIDADSRIVTNEEIDQVALDAFDLITPESLKYLMAMTDDQKVTRQQFCDYALNCPEVASFLNCYDDIVIGESNGIATDASTKDVSARLIAEELNDEKIQQQQLSEPWRDQQRFLRPDTTSESDVATPPPMDGLRLDRICGRNSSTEAVYTSDGDVLYAAGSMVVKLVADDGGYNQDFFNEHSNRVSGLAIFHAKDGMGDTVASSDTGGDDCKVCVWSSRMLSSQVTFETRHKNGASKLCFSPSGEILLTMGNNDMNSTIGVYKWSERRLLFVAKIPDSKFFDCSFLCSDNSFVVCGEDFVHFWSKVESEESFKHYRGATNLFPSREQMTSIACVNGAVVTGSKTSKALWLWEGRVCVKRVEAFRFHITKLFANSAGLFVSTQDGTIHLLDKELCIQRRFDKFSRSDSHIIDTLCYETNREKVLVGDDSNCLREVDLNSDWNFVMSCNSTLTDFTFDTRNDNIITVGEDGFVRKWDKEARVILHQHNLERGLSCVAYKQGQGDEHQMAVGFCKNDNCCSSDKTDVAFVIICGDNLSNVIHYGRNSSQMTLTVCEFSNDGKLLAFGSKDSNIYIHSTDKDFPLIAKARGHSTPILSFDFGCADDFSGSASFLRSNSTSGEVMYWSTHAKKQTPLSQRHTRWETQTCVYGWYLEGAHDLYTEEGNACITSCCPLSSDTIVVGDSSGRLRTLPNPALTKESVYLQSASHHGKVQKIVLVGDLLYTLGKDDSCLCMWKLSSLRWPPTMPPSLYNDHILVDEKKEDQDLSVSLESATAQMEDLDFSTKHTDKISSKVKPFRPWMRSIVPPSNNVPQLGPLPNSSLALERIHGFNSSTKDNLHYISGESIVYSVGRTLVRYDEVGDVQHFCSVDGRIKCLAIHQERSLCAIGQENSEQGIVVIDLKTMQYMSLCKSSVAQSLDFDESGRYLLALSESRLTVHDIDNETIVASTLTHATQTLDVRFTTKANAFVEVGRNFVRLWAVKGNVMSFDEVDMSSMENPTTFYTCVGWMGSYLIVGASTGDVIRFAGTTPISKIKAHTSKITNIATASDGKFAISAANSIKLYDSKLRCIIAIDTELLGVTHQISSLSWHGDMRKILIGTEGNEVWELSSDDGSNINNGPLVAVHASPPRAICAHPNGVTFATVADDGFLRIWGDDDENSSLDLTMPSRACAYSPSGMLLAVGFGKPVKDTAKTINGKFIIIHVDDSSYRIIAERRDSRSFIREMKWHCNGDRLAVGSDKIYVYQLISETNPAVKVDISLISTIDMTSPPIHFDWSTDGKYLRVNSEANELMWFEADPAIRISEASKTKDIEWESNTCVFDWNVQGTHHPEGWEVRSLDCYTEDCSCVVTGGDDGMLRQYSYPCTSTRANYLPYAGHGGAVTSVEILKGGSHVISAGADDAIMVWRHEIDENYGDHLLNERQETSKVDTVNASDMYPAALYVSSDYQIMYPTSGVCAVLDLKRDTHNLFQKHDSQIRAVATTKSRHLVASGDSSSDFPTKIWIWDPQTCTEIALLSDSRLTGVSVLAFSPDEKKLACISSDENHRIFVWSTINGNWSDAYLSAYSLGGHEQISFVQFTQTQLIAGGRNNLNFWSFAPNLSVCKGVVSRNDALLCSAMMNGKLITGTSEGSFVIWDITEKKIVKEFKAHNSHVTSLCACREGIISGCSDGSITIWSSDTFQKKLSFHVGTSRAIDSIDICPHSNGLSTMKILAVSDSKCFIVSCVTGSVTSAAKIPTAGEVSAC